MAKKRKKLDEESKKNVLAYKPFFSPDFKTDLRWWYRNESKVGDKILDLVADVLSENPFVGIGKPEPLKYMGANI